MHTRRHYASRQPHSFKPHPCLHTHGLQRTHSPAKALRGERAELEQLLHESHAEASQLASQLAQARADSAAACEEAEGARVRAAAARGAAEERAAELRVAQDTLRAMREEVNERWVGVARL